MKPEYEKLPEWRSHKIVRAAPFLGTWSVDQANDCYWLHVGEPAAAFGVPVPRNVFARGLPAIGDYIVVYDDDYVSWSPKSVFEAGYSEIKASAADEFQQPVAG